MKAYQVTPEQVPVVKALESLLLPLSPPLKLGKDEQGCVQLSGTKTVIAFKKEIPGIFFASVMPMKNHVGFYFFPIYTHPEAFTDLDPLLKKMLKGKSCFHVKKVDPETIKAIQDLLQQGLEHYRQIGWI